MLDYMYSKEHLIKLRVEQVRIIRGIILSSRGGSAMSMANPTLGKLRRAMKDIGGLSGAVISIDRSTHINNGKRNLPLLIVKGTGISYDEWRCILYNSPGYGLVEVAALLELART